MSLTIDGLEYELCDDQFSQPVCVGVIGGYQPQQQCPTGQNGQSDPTCQNLKYGASSTIMAELAQFDHDLQCGQPIQPGKTTLALGYSNKPGVCTPCSQFKKFKPSKSSKPSDPSDPSDPFEPSDSSDPSDTSCPNNNVATSLLINDDVLNTCQDAGSGMYNTFDLQCLHKHWGSDTNNNGVNAQNAYISPAGQTVRCVDRLDQLFGTSSQKVIVLEAHGSQYDGKIMGVVPDGKTTYPVSIDQQVMPQGPAYKAADTGQFVGSVVATRKAYGPGVYNILAYTPCLTLSELGYVFAIWPFHYSEVYNVPNSGKQSSQARGDLASDNASFPCFGQCDLNPLPKTAPCYKCPGIDHFDVINHEIDIEIPANVNGVNAKAPDPSKAATASNRGCDTMNFNTWVNDINNYQMDTGAYYQNLGVRAPTNTTFVSSDSKWHWYTIDWKVDNDDFTKNSVSIYFDDPFDPTCTAKHNQVNLPSAPHSKPLATTQRFVPTRAGRLNIGPWFGWWGFTDPQNPTGYHTKAVGIAHISIASYQTGFAFVQTYDQSYIAQDGQVVDIRPDFVDFYSKNDVPNPVFDPGYFPVWPVSAGTPNTCIKPPPTPPPPTPPPPPPPTPPPPPPTTNNMPVWLIVVLVCASIMIIAGIGAAIYYKHKTSGQTGTTGKTGQPGQPGQVDQPDQPGQLDHVLTLN
jgi:hypothetical protein